MKIAVVSSTVFSVPLKGYGGLEAIAWEIARGLAAKGHQVSLVTPDGSECPGVEIIPTGPPGQHDEKMAYGGYPEHKEGDVVRRRGHAGYWQHLVGVYAVIDHSWQKNAYLRKEEGVLKVPVLGVMHAPVNTMYGRTPPVEKPCTVCISKDQADHYNALFSSGEARVAYNGIDLDFYKPMGITRSRRFLFLARFSTIKGPDLAIEACRAAGVGLDLIGDTSITNEPQFLDQCKNMAVLANAEGRMSSWQFSDQVRMVGPAKRGECVWWYSQAHCMLHPNMRFREPFGLAPIEAMACGCPVIAWDYGAMRETVKHSYTGSLVKSMKELIERIRYCSFTDPIFGNKQVEVWRKSCREWASQFSIQRMVSRYEELCVEAVDTGGW